MELDEFDKLVKDETTLVDFSAEWCGPCKMMAPIVEELKEEGYNIVEIDVDAHHEIAAEFNIRSIPTFLVFKQGEVVERVIGAQSKLALEDLML